MGTVRAEGFFDALDLVPQITLALHVDSPTKYNVIFANSAFKEQVSRFTDVSKECFWKDHFDESSEEVRQNISEVISSGNDKTLLSKIICSPNETFPTQQLFRWRLRNHADKQLVIITGERHMPELDSEEKNELEGLRDYFDNGPIAMHWLTGEGNVLWANKTELQTLGYTKEEYFGKPILKFCAPCEEDLVLKIFKQLGSGNTIQDVPVKFLKKNGDPVHLLVDSNVKYHADGSFHHTRCFIRDDTKRIKLDAVCRYVEQILGFLGHNVRNPLTTLLHFQDDLLTQTFDSHHGPLLADAIERLRTTTDETMLFQDIELMEKLTSVPTVREELDKVSLKRSDILSRVLPDKQTLKAKSAYFDSASTGDAESVGSSDQSKASASSKEATLDHYFNNKLHTVFTFDPPQSQEKQSVCSGASIDSLEFTRVLHVDDEKMIQIVSKHMFRKSFPHIPVVDYADDGLEALKMFKCNKPDYYDCILMDLVMPNMNGFDAAKALREAGYKGPIIAVSANASKEQRHKAVAMGMDDFVAKPFDKISINAAFDKISLRLNPPGPPRKKRAMSDSA